MAHDDFTFETLAGTLGMVTMQSMSKDESSAKTIRVLAVWEEIPLEDCALIRTEIALSIDRFIGWATSRGERINRRIGENG